MTKFSLLKDLLLSLSLLMIGASYQSLGAQSNLHSDVLTSSVRVECLYLQYQDELNNYYQKKVKEHQRLLNTRSNNGKFELRIYVDTSYERRRTGVYNRNDSVIAYLNKLVDSVEWLFNVSASNWDIDIETDILFFDAQTPFSYGANTSETLINFYDWVDSQGYPGNDDNYVLYTGNYTNQGVSFVGALCAPGGTVMGYVNSFVPNVDLSSHEWIGHAANSLHYNTEVNIMNSFAGRPWNAPSLQVIQDFLDNQSCVVNAQPPLALSFELFNVNLIENTVKLDWKFDQSEEVEYFSVERRSQNEDWKEIGVNTMNQYYADRLDSKGTYYYRIHAYLSNQNSIGSDIKTINYAGIESISMSGFKIINPEGKLICIFDFFGRQLLQSSERIIDINGLNKFQNILIQYDHKMIKWILYD